MTAHLPSVRTVGAYRLVDLLGRGGMGEVYRAVHMPTGRLVAVKLLTQSSAEIVQRFANEARLQASLAHPNIARVEAFFEADGRPCLAMEYVDGETLADRIKARGRLAPRDAFPLFRAVVAATAHLHSAGIVHRALKPTNVRIASGGEVKLLDFGVAKGGSSPALTRVGSVVGTPLYLSPEQLRSGAAAPASDVWALGVVFYEMLAGRVPFEAATFPELWARVEQGTFAPLAPGEPGESRLVGHANALIAACLASAPEARPTAAVLLHRIDRAMARESLAGARRFPWPRTAGRRGRIALAAAILLAVLWAGRGLLPAAGAARPADARRSAHVIDVVSGRADVYVNGARLGQTPYRYEARPHEIVELELQQTGYQPLRQHFDVTTRGAWTFTLRAAGATP